MRQLLGDPGKDGGPVRLPVDGFYDARQLVIEYREPQHERPGPSHWNREAISGTRDQQRQRYDDRRDVEILAHGLILVVMTPGQLDSTKRRRLRRQDG